MKQAIKRFGLSMLLGAFAIVGMTGCATAPVMPPRGVLYTDHKAPMFPGEEPGVKSGEASAMSILGLIAVGDASIAAAADDGNLVEINHVDYKNQIIFFGVYQKFTTIAEGE